MIGGVFGARDRARDAWEGVCADLQIDSGRARARALEALSALQGGPPMRQYSALPQSFLERVQAMSREMSLHQTRWVLDLLVIELVRQFDERFERAEIPDRLLPYYGENIERILARTSQPGWWARSATDDIFVKDLGILTMTLIPCASHLVFRNSGVPRSLLMRQRPRAMARALQFFLLRAGGFAPFLENHVHPAMLDHFNPQGRERCYQLVAQLLQRWPDSMGLMGLSWYYDPAVATISPRLAYLRQVPERHGAIFLPAGVDQGVIAGATATSPTRRKLHEAGAYRPTRYLMAWARDDLLAFCRG